MAELTLRFTPSVSTDTGSFRLLELPSELCKLVESAIENQIDPELTIKGNPDEDAVLCTAEKTYTIRSIVLSNSVLVVSPGDETESGLASDVIIRDQLNDVLELIPSVPRLSKLDILLRGREFGEDEMDTTSDGEDNSQERQRKLSYQDARNMLQASDAELGRGLRDRRVLILDNDLRPLSPSYLMTILELLLTYLVSLSLPHDAAPVEDLISALSDGYDVRREIGEQVMSWFGEIKDGKWKMEAENVVREIGLGILRPHKDEPIPQDEFLKKWRERVGDTFEATVSLSLLSGDFLSSTDTLRAPPALTYFPSSQLPTDPASRFTDLFLMRPRWKAEEIAPFLADIVVDTKERDKLLLKHARAVTDAEGSWYTARAKLSG